MAETTYSEHTKKILDAVSIAHFNKLTDIDPDAVAAENIDLFITDRDGVLGPYNAPTNKIALDHLGEIANATRCGAAIITSNPNINPDICMPPNVSFHKFTAGRPWDFKPSPFLIKKALKEHTAKPELSMAVGDGLRDLTAHRLAGVRKLGMIASMGGHWAEEIVWSKVYRPLSRIGTIALQGRSN